MLASCTTSLSLCKSFSKNSFFLLSTTYNYLSICFRCRSFLKADAKVQLFLIPRKTFAKKNAIFIQILTLVYTICGILWAHTLFVLRASVGVDKTYGTYGTNKTDRVEETDRVDICHIKHWHSYCLKEININDVAYSQINIYICR